MPKVVITGGSGLLGPWVIREFVDHGYEVLNVDTKIPEQRLCPTLLTDLTNLGETFEVLAGADAVVHLAAIPAMNIRPSDTTFYNNTITTYNILEAASTLRIQKAVITSSESSYGIVFALHPFGPQYVPMDEAHPQLPQDAYGLSKIVNELTADMFHRKSGMQIASFRLGNVISPDMYKNFPSFIHDADQRDRILWSYIDTRDAATAYRLAVEADGLGCIRLNIAADDTSMDIKSRDLMAAKYPEVTDFREPLNGYESLLSNRMAKEVLGWEPVHRWRDYV
ncbi:NAD(P)-dependent oxidoreductase [Alicyclobacillus fastidiosus]|uniref:NAD(P)-dependent oxidoreductase n=1 Tax=Alicyclobacillus fastidiosus TaxID=392011 RepID=A0ABY6ZEK8_9BACL|nr:NAD(P)-dependent oxidoreductase [Alicyclobacillus fastidiosus]WAH40983.1 NAD(P)-dependent oxidoreductase [Alicyclobacillus fastidiosus]GMA62497.1 nucleoside-diphosphate-sugar epimerase [Alicyclobacillus fastidiosus]